MNKKVVSSKSENLVWDKFKELVNLEYNGKMVVEYKPSRFERVIKKGWDKQLHRVDIEQYFYRERGLVIAL